MWSSHYTLHTTHTHSTLHTTHTLCICKYTHHALHNGQWTLNLGNWTVYRRSCSYNTFEGQDTSNLGRCRSYYTLKGQNRGSLLNGVCILSYKSCLWIDWWKYPNLFSLSIHFIRKCITEVFIVGNLSRNWEEGGQKGSKIQTTRHSRSDIHVSEYVCQLYWCDSDEWGCW